MSSPCECRCHDGEAIFCSCFVPCCDRPYTPREKAGPACPSYVTAVPPPASYTSIQLPVVRRRFKRL